MNTTKRRPLVGDEAWFVEWCAELAFYEDSEDVDHDKCKMCERQFATREAAEEFAKKIWPWTTKTFGIVEYWHAVFTPYDEGDAARFPWAGYWEASEEYPEIYEGPDDE